MNIVQRLAIVIASLLAAFGLFCVFTLFLAFVDCMSSTGGEGYEPGRYEMLVKRISKVTFCERHYKLESVPAGRTQNENNFIEQDYNPSLGREVLNNL